MSITIPALITGAAQTGFTSPTYSTVPDVAPESNGRQVAVIAIGGTQVGVVPHNVSSPFTLTFFKPKVLRVLGVPGNNGYINNVPVNSYKLVTRKGVIPLAGQPSRVMPITTHIEVPSGADSADPASVRAALSAHIGLLTAIASGIGDTSVTGVM